MPVSIQCLIFVVTFYSTVGFITYLTNYKTKIKNIILFLLFVIIINGISFFYQECIGIIIVQCCLLFIFFIITSLISHTCTKNWSSIARVKFFIVIALSYLFVFYIFFKVIVSGVLFNSQTKEVQHLLYLKTVVSINSGKNYKFADESYRNFKNEKILNIDAGKELIKADKELVDFVFKAIEDNKLTYLEGLKLSSKYESVIELYEEYKVSKQINDFFNSENKYLNNEKTMMIKENNSIIINNNGTLNLTTKE